MAKPTARVEKTTEEPTLDLDVLVRQFAARQEAFNEFLDIVQLLHERRILAALKGALENYEGLLEVLAEWLNSMGAQNPANLMGLIASLSKADTAGLGALIAAASKGAAAATSPTAGPGGEPPNLEVLMKSLEEEDVKKGLWVFIQILRELGRLGGEAPTGQT